MHPQQPSKIQLSNTADYRETYANSVQVRVSLWDFFLSFGTINQTAPDAVSIQNFQGIFLSPQQAKALAGVLNQNVAQYEATFGTIQLEPHGAAPVTATRTLLPLRLMNTPTSAPVRPDAIDSTPATPAMTDTMKDHLSGV